MFNLLAEHLSQLGSLWAHCDRNDVAARHAASPFCVLVTGCEYLIDWLTYGVRKDCDVQPPFSQTSFCCNIRELASWAEGLSIPTCMT